MKTTIAVVEDNAGICEELRQFFAETEDIACVCFCRNLETAMRKIPPLAPDVIVMDIQLPDGSGIAGTSRLKQLLPRSQIVMYTVSEEAEPIYQALQAGASGYLLKRTPPAQLLRAIREVQEGGVPMTGEVARKVIQAFRRTQGASPAIDVLTKREEEVLDLLSKGCSTAEIGERLQIGLGTVNSHLKHIYEKLHVRSRTEAVIKYLG